jgi:hypothetical protein
LDFKLYEYRFTEALRNRRGASAQAELERGRVLTTPLVASTSAGTHSSDAASAARSSSLSAASSLTTAARSRRCSRPISPAAEENVTKAISPQIPAKRVPTRMAGIRERDRV